MPATSKVLSIIDKGVRDRVTKNGETLRRHAESAQRWKSLRERINRTDKEMENVKKILLNGDSDHESSTSGTAGYLVTPPSASRVSRISSTGSLSLSESISPFRRIANKITGSKKSSPRPTVPPLIVAKKSLSEQPSSSMSSTGTMRRQRRSVFGPPRSTEPSTSPALDTSSTQDSKFELVDNNGTIKSTGPVKQRWNSSTKVETENKGTIRKPSSRPPSSAGNYGPRDGIPRVSLLGTPHRRSLSRASMASSRPWSPITSSYSTTHSSSQFHLPSSSVPMLRASSAAQTPPRGITPLLAATPRTRLKTTSHIPGPKISRSISGAASAYARDDDDLSMDHSHSPTFSTSGYENSPLAHPPRPPSRSMIPVPSVHLRTPSRPASAMSNFSMSEGPTTKNTFRADALRAQTPEHTLRLRTQQLPFYQGTVGRSGRPSVPKLPPSSFKDRDCSNGRMSSRPGSRTGAYTPSVDVQHEYIPENYHDPLDLEVASIVNSIPHGLLVERVDPPLKKNQIPKENEEIKAQYAFSSGLSRKVVTCKLTRLARSGKGGEGSSKKVMCRVGGGK